MGWFDNIYHGAVDTAKNLFSAHPDILGVEETIPKLKVKEYPTAGDIPLMRPIQQAPITKLITGGPAWQTKTPEEKFAAAPAPVKVLAETGAGVARGMLGTEIPDYLTKNKIANIIGEGLGFIAGGEVMGAAKLGGQVLGAAQKALPILSTAGKTLVPRVATKIAQEVIRGGTEMMVLSGIHSILNADDVTTAKQRAEEYGLGALLGAPVGAVGGELLGAIAKRLKPTVASTKAGVPLKGHTEPLLVDMPDVTPEVHKASQSVIATQTDQQTLHQAGDILKNIIDHDERYTPEMVREAKLSLVELQHKMDELSKPYKTEMAEPFEDLSKQEFQGIFGQDVQMPKAGEVEMPKTPPQPTAGIVASETPSPYGKAPAPKTKADARKKWREKLYQDWFDTNRPVEILSRQTKGKEYILATNYRMASAITQYIFDKKLVGQKGNILGKSLRELVEGKLPTSERDVQEFWANWLLDKMSKTPENAAIREEWMNAFSDAFQYNLPSGKTKYSPPELFAQLDDWISTFAKSWDTTPQDIYKQLIKITPRGEAVNPLELLLQTTDRIVKGVKYNDVMVELANSVAARADELKNVIEDITHKGLGDIMNTLHAKMPDGKEIILLVKDKDLYKGFTDLIKGVGEPHWVTKIVQAFKNVITVKNPLFAFRNFFKDWQSAHIKTSGSLKEYGSEYVESFKTGWKTAPEGSGKQLYEAMGGGGGLFFRTEAEKTAEELVRGATQKYTITTPWYTRAWGGIRTGARKTVEGVSWFNETVESIPRIAEFNRVFNETGDLDRALFAANDITVNFSRGGTISKQLNQYVPYFNAGMQGLDNLIRSFSRTRVIATLIKGGIVITAPRIALEIMNYNDPNYQALSEYEKDNYFIIPITGGKFLKIPASRDFNVLFGAMLDSAVRFVSSEDKWKDVRDFAYDQLGAIIPDPISGDIRAGLLGERANWDFFFKHPIMAYNLEKGPKHLQFNKNTNTIIKAVAQMVYDTTGYEWSPIMIQDFIISYFGEIGQMVQEVINVPPDFAGAGMVELKKWVAEPSEIKEPTTKAKEKKTVAKLKAPTTGKATTGKATTGKATTGKATTGKTTTGTTGTKAPFTAAALKTAPIMSIPQVKTAISGIPAALKSSAAKIRTAAKVQKIVIPKVVMPEMPKIKTLSKAIPKALKRIKISAPKIYKTKQ